MADPVTRQHGGTGKEFPEMPLGPPGPGSVSPPDHSPDDAGRREQGGSRRDPSRARSLGGLMVRTFPLFEDDHGMRCARCKRLVERGQPYQSIAIGMYENGDECAELRCVYCVTGQP